MLQNLRSAFCLISIIGEVFEGNLVAALIVVDVLNQINVVGSGRAVHHQAAELTQLINEEVYIKDVVLH